MLSVCSEFNEILLRGGVLITYVLEESEEQSRNIHACHITVSSQSIVMKKNSVY